MKKGFIYLFMLVMGVVSLAACGSDNDNDDNSGNGGNGGGNETPTTNYAEEIAGTYPGDMAISFSKVPGVDSTTQTIYVTKMGEKTVKLELREFKFGGISIGDIVVDNITVNKADKTYSFEATQKLTLTIGDMNVNVKGTVVGDQIKLVIVVKDVAAVGDVTVNFTGKKSDE